MRVIICCWDMTVSMTVLALLAVDHSEVRGPVFTDVCLTAVTRHHMTVSALRHSSHLPTFCRRHMAPKSVGDTIIFSGLWIKIRRAGACYRAVPSEILRLKYILYRSSLSSALVRITVAIDETGSWWVSSTFVTVVDSNGRRKRSLSNFDTLEFFRRKLHWHQNVQLKKIKRFSLVGLCTPSTAFGETMDSSQTVAV